MAAPLVPIIVAALVVGGGVGGVAYYDGAFATPLSEIDASMVNETITVKGIVEESNYIGMWSFAVPGFGMSGGDNSWFLLKDSNDGTQAYALVVQGGEAPEEGETYVVTGKLLFFTQFPGDGQSVKLAYIESESFHKPLLFS